MNEDRALEQQFLDRAKALTNVAEVYRCLQVTMLICDMVAFGVRAEAKIFEAAYGELDPSGYDACKKVKGLKRHVLVLLNVVVHPADIQNRDRGCAGRYDYSRSIERIFANDADAGRKKAMAAIIIRPPRHDPHHDQLMPSVDPDLLLSKFEWTQLDTCRVSE